MKRFHCLLVVQVVALMTMQAQEVLWSQDLKDALFNVSWIEQANDGNIIAAGDKGLMGLNNNDGSTLWHHEELKAIDRNSFQLIDGMPLFIVEYKSIVGKAQTLMINAASGAIVFDSKEQEMKILTQHFFPGIASMLFEIKQDGMHKVMLFNYESNEVKWNIELGKQDGLLKSAMRGFAGFLISPPFLIDDQKMMLTEKSQITIVDLAKGQKLWSNEFDDKIKAALYSSVDGKIYAGVKKKMQILETDTGKDITPGKMKLAGSLEDLFANEDNNIVIVTDKGFNILDPKSGDFLWKKFFDISGLYQVLEIDGHYFAIGNENKDATVAKVTKEGKKVWKEGINGQAYYILPIDQGIFYLSTEKSNILTYEEGDKVWKKDIKFSSIPGVDYDEKNDEVVFYENGKLYVFKVSSGDIELLAEKIKFDKSKGAIFEVEDRPNGYFIHSDQHIGFVDNSGKLAFAKYYAPVVTHNFTEMAQFAANVGGVDIDIAGNMRTISALNSLSHGSLRTAGDQSESMVEQSVAGGVYINDLPLFEVTKKRFFNSRNVKDHKYLLTQDGSNQVAMIQKDSGKIEKSIPLTDKTPSYINDEIDNRVFINEKNHLITCYQMK